MVLFDNTFLTLVLHPTLKRPPIDPNTKRVVENIPERVELLLETLENDRETIIIPTPVLTEFLLLIGGDGPRILAHFDSDRNYQVEAFDQRAAVELAEMNRAIRAKGGGRRGDQEGTYAKITFDRQIVAIAKVNGVNTIYSDDDGVKKFAERNGIHVVRTWELPLPPEKHPLFRGALDAPAELIEGQVIESESKDEERKTIGNGAGKTEPRFIRIPTVSEPNTEVSVSTEKRSGRAGSEAGEE
jgi:predicted nucleic acid-binding protein